MKDSYLTLKGLCVHEIKVKGSRFIGTAEPVETRFSAEQILNNIQKKYYNATHHCFAYRLGPGESIQFRYSDDGEPSGTAGKPILDVLDGRQLVNVICIVTRYFGGTKLGTGGLVRAYGRCARETIARAAVVEKWLTSDLTLIFDYELIGTVMSVLARYECRHLGTEYQEKTTMKIAVRRSQTEKFMAEMVNQTAGRIAFNSIEGG
jgi:uncharacterized YigZ family protein